MYVFMHMLVCCCNQNTFTTLLCPGHKAFEKCIAAVLNNAINRKWACLYTTVMHRKNRTKDI